MNARISSVNNIKISTLDSSAIFLVGDAIKVQPRSKVMEVEHGIHPFTLPSFPKSPPPISMPIVQEDFQMIVKNESPCIKVNQVNIRDISTSSVFQVGSNKSIDTQNRKKHIRQLLKPIK